MPGAASSCRPMTPAPPCCAWPRWSARRAPARVIALGDSFHDPFAAERLGAEERGMLAGAAQPTAHFIWIAGNHDPHPPAWLGGAVMAQWREGGLVFPPRTGDRCGAGRSGRTSASLRHAWPSAAGACAGAVLSPMACGCVMPAFGAYAGGLDVGDAAIAESVRRPLPRLHAGAGQLRRQSIAKLRSRRRIRLGCDDVLATSVRSASVRTSGPRTASGRPNRSDAQPMITAISTAARP